MKTRSFRGLVARQIFRILLLAMLAFQSSGLNGLAARSQYFQEGETQPLVCGCASLSHQLVLMIDDSGSMRTNDRGSARNEISRNLVQELAAYQEQAGQELQGIQVAVVHFTDVAREKPRFVELGAQDLDGLIDSINWKPSYATPQATSFARPFEQVRQLYTGGDCIRRSLVLFTDGTPENTQGRLVGQALLDEFAGVSPNTRELLNLLDKISLVLFKADPNYFSDPVQAAWRDSTTTEAGEKLVLYASDQADQLIADILNYARDESFKEFVVDMQVEPAVLKVGSSNEVRLTFLPPEGVALQDVSILPAGKTKPLATSREAEGYRFSWTPESVEASKFVVQANATLDKKERACSGELTLPGVLDGPVTVHDAISLVIMPPREPARQGRQVVLPMRLNYEGEIRSVEWQNAQASVIARDGQALSEAETLTVNVEPDTANNRQAKLIVEPVSGQGEAEIEIVASVAALVGVGSQGDTIKILDSPSNIVIPEGQACVYDRAWDAWFWPLAIVLAGLLALLLVLRIRDARTQKDYEAVGSDMFRIRKWRFLFAPLAILLVALVLNRVWWCYIIPWWLFLASLLGLIVVVFPLAHFIHNERRRAWALLALLLVAAGLIVVVSITIDRGLLWPLMVLLLLAVIGRWYIRPDEQPVPDPIPPAMFSLISPPACVAFYEPIRLPLRFDYLGGAGPGSSLTWETSARIMPEGEAGARIMPVDGKDDEYELVIDPVPYQPGAREIRVQLRAQANGRQIDLPGQSITIALCPPDPLAELEGIGEKVQDTLYQPHELFEQGILTFKQLAGADVNKLNQRLNLAGWKMMDAKTWPQQAKLAAIAREFQTEEDRRNYEAYKAWVKDGIEPDEYDLEEKERRDTALPWNAIPQFTPLVLSLALSPSHGRGEQQQPITLPVQLNNDEDQVRLATVDWEASAQVLPGGEEAAVTVNPIDPQKGYYEIVIASPARNAKKIRLSVRACIHGRSIEIFYGKAITVHVNHLPTVDALADLEGIEAATEKFLNDHGIYSFRDLSNSDYRVINKWLEDAGQKMRDAKTWPQQARLADLARKFGSEEDQRSYQAYKDWLQAGIEPDEYIKDEKERRPAALAWHGTAELTEKAYPDIFQAD